MGQVFIHSRDPQASGCTCPAHRLPGMPTYTSPCCFLSWSICLIHHLHESYSAKRTSATARSETSDPNSSPMPSLAQCVQHGSRWVSAQVGRGPDLHQITSTLMYITISLCNIQWDCPHFIYYFIAFIIISMTPFHHLPEGESIFSLRAFVALELLFHCNINCENMFDFSGPPRLISTFN